MEPNNADYRGEAEYARGVQQEYETALRTARKGRAETSLCARCCCACLGAGD